MRQILEMRKHVIDLRGVTLIQRQELKQLLEKLEEPIYKDTGVFEHEVTTMVFQKHWVGGGTPNYTIKLEDFLIKYGDKMTNILTMRNESINMRDPSAQSLSDLYCMMSRLGENMYLRINGGDPLSMEEFEGNTKNNSYKYSEGKWIGGGTDSTISINDFIIKYDRVSEMVKDMRTYEISLVGKSKEEVSKLRELLDTQHEPIYVGTAAFTGKSKRLLYNFAHWHWANAATEPRKRNLISLEAFLKKFGDGNMKLRDYKIGARGATQTQLNITTKFKAGDMVRFKSKTSKNANYFKDGLEYLVIKENLSSNNSLYSVYEFCDTKAHWSVNEDELEAQPLRTIPKQEHKYKTIGSRVLKIDSAHDMKELLLFGFIKEFKSYDYPMYLLQNLELSTTKPTNVTTMDWSIAKVRMLRSYNALYSYDLPIVYESNSEESEAKDLGIKDVNVGGTVALGIDHGSTHSFASLENLKKSAYIKNGYQLWADLKHTIEGEIMPYNVDTGVVSQPTNYDIHNTVVKVSNKYEFEDVLRYLGWDIMAYIYTSGVDNYYGYDGIGNRVNVTGEISTNINADIIDFSTFHHRFLKDVPQPQKTSDIIPILWKNPKPNKPNTRDILVDDLVLIDGVELCQKVTRITKQRAYIDKTIWYKKEDVYPLFKLSDISNIGVGDIYDNGDGKFDIDTGVSIVAPVNVYSLRPESIKYDAYTCGAIRYKDIEYKTLEELQDVFPQAKLKVHSHTISYNHIEIATHYNIQESVLIPKDLTIAEEVVRALDHPLNIIAKEWALLVGESGTGKTEAAIKYAKSVGKEYIKLQGTAQVTVDDLMGFKSVTTGIYFRSLLRDAVEDGKIFILDEIDACNPNTLLALNGLKQEYYQFPDALIKIHPEFRLIATANTLEYDEKYNARSPMDKATKARFKIIRYEMEDYDLAMRYGLKYICKIDNINRLTAREVSREVIDLKIQEEIDAENSIISTTDF